jgi:hypothetical protein
VIEHLGPDHVVARLPIGKVPRVRRGVLWLLYLLPLVGAVVSVLVPAYRPGFSGLFCWGAMVWGWTLLGISVLGAWHGEPVVPWRVTREVVLEVLGSVVRVDGRSVDKVVARSGEIEVDDRALPLVHELDDADLELLQSALFEARRLRAHRAGGQVPEELQDVIRVGSREG